MTHGQGRQAGIDILASKKNVWSGYTTGAHRWNRTIVPRKHTRSSATKPYGHMCRDMNNPCIFRKERLNIFTVKTRWHNAVVVGAGIKPAKPIAQNQIKRRLSLSKLIVTVFGRTLLLLGNNKRLLFVSNHKLFRIYPTASNRRDSDSS